MARDLVYFNGKAISDPAIIGITENAVKTRMFYARKRPATLLGARCRYRLSLKLST